MSRSETTLLETALTSLGIGRHKDRDLLRQYLEDNHPTTSTEGMVNAIDFMLREAGHSDQDWREDISRYEPHGLRGKLADLGLWHGYSQLSIDNAIREAETKATTAKELEAHKHALRTSKDDLAAKSARLFALDSELAAARREAVAFEEARDAVVEALDRQQRDNEQQADGAEREINNLEEELKKTRTALKKADEAAKLNLENEIRRLTGEKQQATTRRDQLIVELKQKLQTLNEQKHQALTSAAESKEQLARTLATVTALRNEIKLREAAIQDLSMKISAATPKRTFPPVTPARKTQDDDVQIIASRKGLPSAANPFPPRGNAAQSDDDQPPPQKSTPTVRIKPRPKLTKAFSSEEAISHLVDDLKIRNGQQLKMEVSEDGGNSFDTWRGRFCNEQGSWLLVEKAPLHAVDLVGKYIHFPDLSNPFQYRAFEILGPTYESSSHTETEEIEKLKKRIKDLETTNTKSFTNNTKTDDSDEEEVDDDATPNVEEFTDDESNDPAVRTKSTAEGLLRAEARTKCVPTQERFMCAPRAHELDEATFADRLARFMTEGAPNSTIWNQEAERLSQVARTLHRGIRLARSSQRCELEVIYTMTKALHETFLALARTYLRARSCDKKAFESLDEALEKQAQKMRQRKQYRTALNIPLTKVIRDAARQFPGRGGQRSRGINNRSRSRDRPTQRDRTSFDERVLQAIARSNQANTTAQQPGRPGTK